MSSVEENVDLPADQITDIVDNDSDLESDIETSITSGTPIQENQAEEKVSLNARIQQLSQASSMNGYDSEIFDESEDETPKTGNKDLDLQSMFGAKTLNNDFEYDVNTAEGKNKIKKKDFL